MTTLQQLFDREKALDDAQRAATDKELGPCYEAALKKLKLPRPVPKPISLVSSLDGTIAMAAATSGTSEDSKKLKAACAKCDKDHAAALAAINAASQKAVDAALDDAYKSKVWAPAMILTDSFWSLRAKKLSPVGSSGWNKKGRWSFGDRAAIVFEVNTVAQLKAFVSKERLTNTLAILLRRIGNQIVVAGQTMTLPDFAQMVTDLGGQVRVGNVILLGSDYGNSPPGSEQKILQAFHSEILELYVYDEAALARYRTAEVNKVIERLNLTLARVKKQAQEAAAAYGYYAKWAAGNAAVVGVLAAIPPASVPIAVIAGVMGVVAAGSEAVSIHYDEVANDPPRGDYTKRAVFEPVSLPAPASADPLPSLLHEMATAILNEASALDALRITIERLQGADKAAPNIGDDVRYVQRQAKTGMDLAGVVREQIARQKQLRPQLKAEWAKAAPAVSVVIPADYANTVDAQLDQARATLTDNGISPAASQVNALKKAVRAELDPAVGTTRTLSATLPTVSGLTTTDQRMKSLATDLGDVFAAIEAG